MAQASTLGLEWRTTIMETAPRPSFLKGYPAFGSPSFYRGALGIVVPVMLQMVITSMISLVDNFMVAGLGDVKMAAVNVANQINFVYLVVVNAACLAGGIFLSQHRGANDAEGMRQSLRFKLIVALCVAAFHTFLCLTFPEVLIRVMLGGNAQAEPIVTEGARFLRLAAPSFAPFAIAAAVGSSYRDIGRTKAPLVGSSCAAAALSTFLIPLVFGNLSPDARLVTRGLVFVIATYIPLWTLLNAQFSLSRSGGDTAMGLWVDVGVTYAVFLPIAFGLAWWTSLGPVALFAVAKITDVGKISTAFWWLAKEKWVRNLAEKRK